MEANALSVLLRIVAHDIFGMFAKFSSRLLQQPNFDSFSNF